MNYPLISEYEREIKIKGNSVLHLSQPYNFIPSKNVPPIKIYNYGSGAIAGVFKVEGMGKQYALRVFLNGGNPKNINRIIDIAKYIRNKSANFLCEYSLHQRGIVVKGSSFPVILMEWVNGKKLNDYVDGILQQNHKISELQSHLVKLNESLENRGMAHGDIQSGNVLVVEQYRGIQLKLVDYDAMFLPELSGQRAIEVGHSSFQHPKRDKSVYNAEMDRFSFWLIITALEAIKFDKNLWSKNIGTGFNDGDNFLFRAKDLQSPNTSPLIKKLRSINQPSLNFYLDKLLSDSYSPKRDKVALFDEKGSVTTTSRVNTEGTVSEGPKKPTTSVGQNFTSNHNMVFSIDSDPSNAAVYCNGVMLGVTPISLNIAQYSNKRIDLSYGTTKKSFYLNMAQKEYKIKLTEEPKTYVNPMNTSARPSVSPYGQQNKSQTKPVQKENSTNNIALILVISFVSLLLLLFLMFGREGDGFSSYDAPKVEAVDSAWVVADDSVAHVEDVQEAQKSYEPVVKEEPKPTMSLYYISAEEGCGSTFSTNKSEYDRGNYILTGMFTSYFWGSIDKFQINMYINDRYETLYGSYINTDSDSYVFKNDRYSVEIGLNRIRGDRELWLYKGNMLIFNLKNGEQYEYTLYGGSGC